MGLQAKKLLPFEAGSENMNTRKKHKDKKKEGRKQGG